MRVYLCNRNTLDREHIFHCTGVEIRDGGKHLTLFNARNDKYISKDGIDRYPGLVDWHPDVSVITKKYYIHIGSVFRESI